MDVIWIPDTYKPLFRNYKHKTLCIFVAVVVVCFFLFSLKSEALVNLKY